jgi:peptide/nickel transport system substrate-binding protein
VHPTEWRPAPIDRRSFLERALALGISLPTASALLAACGGNGTPGAATGADAITSKTLNLRLYADITTLDPALFANTSSDEPPMASVFEGLVTFKPHTDGFEVVNVLAESFEPSADGLRFDFTLKPDIPFHGNYGVVTAEDVKFSYERLAGLTKPKIESPYSGDWIALKEVEVKDKYSGTIVLKKRFTPLLRTTLPVTSGYVVSKKAVEERGEKFGRAPIGTGPYEFVSHKPKQNVKLKRFSEYGTGFTDAQWEEIVFFAIDEDSAADIALETGEVDFAQISLQSVDRFADSDEFGLTERVTLAYTWIGMNVIHPKLRDVNVRQAIRYAIDVPAMIEAGFEGRHKQATAILPPEMGMGYWEDAPQYERDVDKAKGYLEDAGASGLELTYTYTEEPGANEVAEIAQANLADVGIKLKLNKEDSGTFYELGKRLRDRQLFWGNYETQPDPSWSMVWFTSDQVDEWNWMYWSNKEFDRLQATGLVEQDESKRNEYYIEMQKLWDEAAHTVWLSWPTKHFAFKKGLEPAILPHGRVLPQAFRSA